MRTAVSLFAGVGGFDLALERNGYNVVANVEIDKNARAILKKQFPKSAQFNDVMEVTGEQLIASGFIPNGGIITGGFPCQDLSVAGKRLGFGGQRSSLFYQIARLADETKAEWLVLENVPGLLSSQRGADMGAVVGTLVDLGYSVAWRVLDAQNFGVPQRRRRVFIVARRAGDTASAAKVLFERASLRGNPKESRKTGEETTRSTRDGSAIPIHDQATRWSGKRGDTSDGKGNGLGIGQPGDPINTLTQGDRHAVLEPVQNIISPTLTSYNLDSRSPQSSEQQNILKAVLEATEPVLYEPHHGDGKQAEGVANTLQARMGTGGNTVPVLVDDIARMVAFGEYAIDGTASTVKQRDYKDATDLVVSVDESPVLLTMREGKPGGGKGPLISKISLALATRNGQTLMNNKRVRRLTPTECERLQGFPDGWTDGQADSHRYKQMGNAVAVPVAEWVIEGIREQ